MKMIYDVYYMVKGKPKQKMWVSWDLCGFHGIYSGFMIAKLVYKYNI